MHMVAGRQAKRLKSERDQNVNVVQQFLQSTEGRGSTKRRRGASLKVVQGRRLRGTSQAESSSIGRTKFKLVLRDGKRRTRLPTGQAIEIAFGQKFSVRAMAAIHDVSTRSVLRCTQVGIMA